MKFQQRQVADPRAQENFEQLQTLFPLAAANIGASAVTTAKIADAAVTAAKLATGIVLELAVSGTSRKVAFGSTTVTFTAASRSAITTVTHGLGATPVVVLVTPNTIGSGGGFFGTTGTFTSTTFQTDAWITNGPTTGTISLWWIAIG